MGDSSTVLSTDVLVIGSGIAGCMAAIRAKELGADVLMVDQGKPGFWGMSVNGTHRFRVFHPDYDDLDAVMKGTVMECEYMIDQEYLEGALPETYERYRDMLKLGGRFRTDDSGKTWWYFTPTAYPWLTQRSVVWEPISSYKHLAKFNNEVVRHGVRVVERIFITDLVTMDNAVRGAVGYDTRKGDFYVFNAKAVVMASGTFSGGNPAPRALTGDGIAMALRAGAELRGMEFGKTETGGIPPAGGPVWVYPLGSPEQEVTVTNAKGEKFLEQYELTRKVLGKRAYGPTWRGQLQAILKEVKEGRGPVYVDYRRPNKSGQLREFYGSYFDCTLKQIELSGITLDKIKYELGISRGYSGAGGIRITPKGETSLSGLFSGGIASDMCGYAQYTILSGFSGCSITGRRAGESAAKYAASQAAPAIEAEAERLKPRAFGPLNRKKGMSADDLRVKIAKAWVNIDIRNEANLIKAHEELGELRKEAAELFAPDLQELGKCHKMRNYIECSDAVAVAARARRETRLEHIREDYPLTDNREWVKWVIVRQEGDETVAHTEDVPVQQWKYRPDPVLIDRLKPAKEVLV